MRHFHLHLVSDSTGETVSSVARAAVVQFEDVEPEEHVWTLVRTKSQMDKVIARVEENPGPVLVTLVDAHLLETLRIACMKIGVPCVPVLTTVVNELSGYLGIESHARPGGKQQLDEEYFARVEAINFSLAHDDGQMLWDLEEADIVLVGPSRTSKSPTCMYLAYKGYRSANIPFVSGCPLPPALEDLKKPLVVGLTISTERLEQIRRSRLQSINHDGDTSYVDAEAIDQEIEESRRLFHRKRWPVIDVTKRSVEETAAQILQYYQKYKGVEGGAA